MNIAIVAPNTDTNSWVKQFNSFSKGTNVYIWPNIKDYDIIDCVCLWKHPEGVLKRFKNLKLIYSMGAGVDHIVYDNSLPKNIPLCKISDEKLAFSMSNYIITAVLFYHRRLLKYIDDKKNKLWDNDTHPEVPVKIGILGYGSLGSDAGIKLNNLGFDVIGYSLNKKVSSKIKIYYGNQLNEFLGMINVLVCTVPYTSKTQNLLNEKLFKNLNKGTYLINVSRGKVQNENDIVKFLDNGILSGAFLDVFEEEPLPKSSPLWNKRNVQITPHNASITNQEAAVPQIIDNYKRLLDGKKLINQVNIKNEY
tara:strand:+ start:306 stop:1229 length:924 start_codon:yes stop_codon:yes gene_type:complete